MKTGADASGEAGARGAGGGARGPKRRPRRSVLATLGISRRRLYEVLEHDSVHDRLATRVDFFLLALIVANVVAAIAETVPSLVLRDRPEFLVFEAFSIAVFACEYALRIWVAPENPRYRGLAPWTARRRYVLTPLAIVDLLAWLPFVASALVGGLGLRTLALLRLLRFVKLARYSPGMQSLMEVLRSEWKSLVACFWLLSAVVLVAATAMYVVESGRQPEHFGSIPAAMWWAMATVTTVGYGDVYPLTGPGRVVASFTMLAGIVMLALPVGIIATAFVEVIKRRDFVITWGMVARVPLFADLDATGIAEIHRLLSAQRAEPGEVVVRRGETAHSMYFIASGEVDLEFEDDTVRLGEGQFFGEMALLHTATRAATARARTRAMLLTLDAEDLAGVMRHHPSIGQRIRAMAKDEAGPQPVHRRADIAGHEIEGGASGADGESGDGP